MSTNRLYDEINIGDQASINRVVTPEDLVVFAHASGNLNPMHNPKLDGNADGTNEAIAPSMWVGSLFSAVIGNVLPGIGTLYESQSLEFTDRAHVGESLHVGVTVAEKLENNRIALDCLITRDGEAPIAQGRAVVVAPQTKVTMDDLDVAGLLVQEHKHFDALVARCQHLDPLATAVVCPEDSNSLAGAMLAKEKGLIIPILVGDRDHIEKAAAEENIDLSGCQIEHVEGHAPAASRAVAMVHEGHARAVMKGHIHSDDLLRAVATSKGGLRTNKRITHIFVMDVPGVDHLISVSDAAVNILPDLETKVQIVQNAIDLVRSIGTNTPRVGILSAVETVNPKIPSTLDAAVISKMAERGQIRGGIVDGPLAMDNAMDIEAARTKGIKSLVAGQADVLIVPNLEAGNMLAKELTFVAHAEAAGLVLGAKVPVMLTSRADNAQSRLASCALAIMYDYFLTHGEPYIEA